ncbi:CapA family protein [Bacillus alkalicellulosilyticus]|uniref:CapA family protein n=1 Tax=Alkalihalobacterium alkalicellulosilyticum TaxID=1912214 RepID=UPI00099797F7|nr:CapA family protein [Bacillus alkalicellulosilyticus]
MKIKTFLLFFCLLILMLIFFLFMKKEGNASPFQSVNLSNKEIITHEKEYVDYGSPITIVFAGDLMMSGSVADTVERFGVNYPFEHVEEEIKKADYAVVNLETAVTHREETYGKQFNFKMPPSYLDGVRNAGFDMVSLANNHTMDYREAGLVDTMNYLDEYGLAYIGAGLNKEEAYSAKYVTIKGRSIAFLGFSRVLPTETWYAREDKPGIASGYQLERMLDIIAKEKEIADYVLVYIHWGIERSTYPEPYQIYYGEAMIDAGADAVIGAHPHVLQPIETYNGKPIAYSLGNFLFPNYVTGPTAETGLFTLELDEDKINYQWSSYQIRNDQIWPES